MAQDPLKPGALRRSWERYRLPVASDGSIFPTGAKMPCTAVVQIARAENHPPERKSTTEIIVINISVTAQAAAASGPN